MSRRAKGIKARGIKTKGRRHQEPKEFDTITELVRTLRLYSKLNPTYHNQNLLVIKSRCEFEPHGRASETWEMIWYVELPFVQYHWKSTAGWKPGTPGLNMRFSGRTLYEAMMKLSSFLGDMAIEGKELEWL